MTFPRVCSESLENLPDLALKPAEIEISLVGNHPVSEIPASAIPRYFLNDIARALVDRGWRYGVRGADVRVSREYHRARDGRPVGATRVKARLTYAA
jgi:hypothetical protein